MPFSDDEDVLPGGSGQRTSEQSFHADERVANALSELRKIVRQETALRVRIDDLTRPYKLPTGRRL